MPRKLGDKIAEAILAEHVPFKTADKDHFSWKGCWGDFGMNDISPTCTHERDAEIARSFT